MIIDGETGKKVHFPGYMPTSLSDTSIFGTGEDGTDLTLEKDYFTDRNLPWATNLLERFD